MSEVLAGLIGAGFAVAGCVGLGLWSRKRRESGQDAREGLLHRYQEAEEARRKAAIREAFLRGHRHGYREGRHETLDTLFGDEDDEDWFPPESPADEAVRESQDIYEQ